MRNSFLSVRHGWIRFNALLCFVVMISSIATIAKAATVERHALIIGNSNYKEGALKNPKFDAIDVSAQLESLGYRIYLGGPALNLDRLGIERTLKGFAQQLPQNAEALLYFAGHGMATVKDNYLIPVNHKLEYEEQLPDRAVSLRSAVDLLKNSNPEGVNVVLLDACRNNPLGRSFRSSRVGLSRLVDIPTGVFIGYAADAGQVAGDGILRNGTYTSELLAVMRERPDVIIEVAHKEVAARVYQKTGGKQFPVSENKVYGNWCFGSCESPVVSTAPVESPVQTTEAAPKSNNRWLIVGGAVLGAVALGLLSGGSGGGGSGDDGSDNTNFTLQLTPP